MERFSRAERRAQTDRLKVNRKSYYGYSDKTPKQLGRAVTDAAPCSCPMCGNPRRHFGHRSIQEQRQSQKGVHHAID